MPAGWSRGPSYPNDPRIASQLRQQARVLQQLAKVEGAPPSEDGAKKLWRQVKGALGL